MNDRRDRALIIYALLTHLDEARISSRGCTHHFLEHRLRSNWKAVEHLLGRAVSRGWVEFDSKSRVYRITDQGRAFRALLQKAVASIYTEYLNRRP